MQHLKSGLVPNTVRRDLAELKAALTRVMKWGYSAINPASQVKVNVETYHRVRFLADNERTDLLSALNARDEKQSVGREPGKVFRLKRGYAQKPKLGEFSDYLLPWFCWLRKRG